MDYLLAEELRKVADTIEELSQSMNVEVEPTAYQCLQLLTAALRLRKLIHTY